MARLVKQTGKVATPFAFRISGNLIKTNENTSVRAIARTLAKHKVGAIIVEKKGRLAGIISERDIVWRVVAKGKSCDRMKAKDIMTRDVVSVDLNEGTDTVFQTMSKAHFRHLPVRKGARVIGMVSTRDLMYLRRLKVAK